LIYRVEVWITLQDGQHLAGEMVCDIAETGSANGAFRYDRNYLRLPGAFALDPVSLPLKPETFHTGHPGIFGVFVDSLPDDWGRRLLVRKHHLPRHLQNLPTLLLALGSSGLGALSYTESGQPVAAEQGMSTVKLAALLHEAWLFEHGETQDSELSLLFAAASSPGGARPKALVYDELNQKHFLAKFPSTKDYVDVVKIEAATMNLAAKAGLKVPYREVVTYGGKSVFLIERFDITPAGRRHMISMQTLLKMEGYYICRYANLLGIVRKISSAPQIDAGLIFRQMVFNAVVGNTDDHLKNFWMLCDENGWRLSPSFDLIPDISQSGEHVLRFDLDSHYPGRKKLEKLGILWGIPHARTIVAEVFEVVATWKAEFARFGVSTEDTARFIETDRRLSS